MMLLYSNLFIANKTFLAVFVFCFFLVQQALSNVHSVRATATDKDPLTWNFNPKVLSPIFTLLTLYHEILVVRLQYPVFLASTRLSSKVATVRESTEKVIFIVKP